MISTPDNPGLILVRREEISMEKANALYGPHGIGWRYHDELRPGENPEVQNVSGYRKLDDNELHLINKIKAHGPVLEQLLADVEELIKQRTATYGTPDAEHYRNLALGKTNIQQGYMWLIRAVAAPNGLV